MLLCLVALIAIDPPVICNGLEEDTQRYFQNIKGDSPVICHGLKENKGWFRTPEEIIEETGYKPWFSPIWEPPGKIESLLFSLQAAIGGIIIGYIFGLFKGQAKEKKDNEEEMR